MRIYVGYAIALNEIKRDLSEMGTLVHPATVQNKDVAHNPDFDTLELTNYTYTITQPDTSELSPIQPWADAEWKERLGGIEGNPVNPGEAYKLRADVWNEFINEDGFFDYTYAERLHSYAPVAEIINRISVDAESRQLFLSVWRPSDISYIGGIARVPCTLGYLFQVRGGQVNMTYLQRSADFMTHFHNDLFLSRKLQEHVAEQTGYAAGHFTHWIGSLHMFRRDAQGVF